MSCVRTHVVVVERGSPEPRKRRRVQRIDNDFLDFVKSTSFDNAQFSQMWVVLAVVTRSGTCARTANCNFQSKSS